MMLTWAIGLYVLLECSNVAALYFAPGSRRANAMGVFTAWEKSKADPEVHDLVRYLVSWVAGTKLIFLALLVVILTTAPATTRTLAGVVLAASIATFFWRLFPLARRIDAAGGLTPRGYSKTLGLMIAGMIVLFTAATLWSA